MSKNDKTEKKDLVSSAGFLSVSYLCVGVIIYGICTLIMKRSRQIYQNLNA